MVSVLKHPKFETKSESSTPQQPTLLMPEPHQFHQPPPSPPKADPNPVASTAANAHRNPVLFLAILSVEGAGQVLRLIPGLPFSLAVEVALPLPLPEIAVPPVQPTMIIKGMLGRYERWNPVHPTVGAFWGVGLGLGCGVGWGPGFGPEVIGYVGAGCGVGFSVGVTLAGVGVGLPQHGIIKNHYHGGFTNNVPFESARFYTLTILRGMVWDAISYVSHIAATRKESRQKLLKFEENPRVSGGVDLPKLGKGVSSSFRSTMDCIRAFTNQHRPP